MPTGHRHEGVDFEDIYAPYVSGAKAGTTNIKAGGVDLKDIFAPLTAGLRADDTGHFVSGVNTSDIFAALGTTNYQTNVQSSTLSFAGAATSATIGVRVETNGEITITAETGGVFLYHYPVAGGVGSLYQFRISGTVNGTRNSTGATANMTGKGGVSFTAAVEPGNTAGYNTGWLAADDAANFLTMQANSDDNFGLGQVDGNMVIEIRRVSDSVVVKTYNLTFTCLADSQM